MIIALILYLIQQIIFKYSINLPYIILTIMISLEIAISNFKSYNYQQELPIDITLKFAQITAHISLNSGQGGKCLFLDISPQQLQQIYRNYACGLFIINKAGKFYSLLSLQRLKIEDNIICNEICFLNDQRQAKYHCQFSFVAKAYKNPKIADTSKFQMRQNALESFKKPPIPKQKANPVKQKQPINSFLYGNKPSFEADNLQTLKQDLRKSANTKANLQKMRQTLPQKPQTFLSKQMQSFEEDDLLDSNPPMMEFTNDEPQQIPLKVPQIGYLQYQESIQQSVKSKSKKKAQKTPKQNNFLTFNKNEYVGPKNQSPQTLSQFQLSKNQLGKDIPKRPSYSKQQMKQLAKQQAQNMEKQNDKVMIPIARGDKFELVPLSSLKPEQIIDYVQNKRKEQQQRAAFQLRKKKLEERQRQIEEKNRKLQQMVQKKQIDKQSSSNSAIRRPSKEIRSSINKQIKQQDNDEQEEQDDEDYMSDFESVSASNSIIRSRISSRGNNKNISKEEQNVMQDDYSQDFDSYSHSMLSKTNKKEQSISDYSQSYRSITTSYKK